jgi:dTMP kinase
LKKIIKENQEKVIQVKMENRGKYIMIEGGEGCGKDEQARLLLNSLIIKGYGVILTREPGGTPEAEKIRSILLDKSNNLSPLEELFLFESARSINYRQVVIPELELGSVVIKTRGWPSTVAYQGYAGNIDLGFINQLNQKATLGIRPDLLFVIDISAKLGLEKETNPDRFATKGIDYHKKVNSSYLKIAKQNPDFSIVIPYRKGSIVEMQSEIRHYVRTKLDL